MLNKFEEKKRTKLNLKSISIGGVNTPQLLFYILISQNDASSGLVFLKKFGNYEQ